MNKRRHLNILVFSAVVGYCVAFVLIIDAEPHNKRALKVIAHASTASSKSSFESSRLSQEFKTSKGELLDPFRVLRLERTATTDEVKQAYRKLSRRYHPDVVMHKEILPGRCNDLEDVRDEWERIQLSYTILKSNKLRTRYERNEMWSDPGKVLQRAATSAAWQGITGVGKGIFGAGFSAVSSLLSEEDEKKDKRAGR